MKEKTETRIIVGLCCFSGVCALIAIGMEFFK